MFCSSKSYKYIFLYNGTPSIIKDNLIVLRTWFDYFKNFNITGTTDCPILKAMSYMLCEIPAFNIILADSANINQSSRQSFMSTLLISLSFCETSFFWWGVFQGRTMVQCRACDISAASRSMACSSVLTSWFWIAEGGRCECIKPKRLPTVQSRVLAGMVWTTLERSRCPKRNKMSILN